ncbi:hypothetical protein [Xanthomonas sp. MUS 060]|uniref:hypothetical protein n=1 Tax=Xanthomonas sp. MUS 060 TaxID=1588031 RepID=UPI000AA9DF9A|nr:hypothetical protein [Xanthomonas sp. MUS 060]
MTLPLPLADALLIGRQRLANAGLAGLLGIVLGQPAAHGAIDQVQIDRGTPGQRSDVGCRSCARPAEGGIEGSAAKRCNGVLPPRWG